MYIKITWIQKAKQTKNTYVAKTLPQYSWSALSVSATIFGEIGLKPDYGGLI